MIEVLLSIVQSLSECYQEFGYCIAFHDAVQIINELMEDVELLQSKFLINLLVSHPNNIFRYYQQINRDVPEWYFDKYQDYLIPEKCPNLIKTGPRSGRPCDFELQNGICHLCIGRSQLN